MFDTSTAARDMPGVCCAGPPHEVSLEPSEGVEVRASHSSRAAQHADALRNRARVAMESLAESTETPLLDDRVTGDKINGSLESESRMSVAGVSRKKKWRPHCRHTTCLRPASYAESGEHDPVFCDKHKEEGMENVVHPNRGECNHVGCTRVSAYASTADTRGRFCHLHKKKRMVKVRDKIGTRCEELTCVKQASFALDGERYPRFCKDHKKNDMVNIRNLRCMIQRCPRGASFAAVGDRRGVYCGEHKKDGMVNTRRRPRCVAPGCTSREPVYVLRGQQVPKYCVNHRGEGMTDMRSTIRTQCTILPSAVQPAKYVEGAPTFSAYGEREAALELLVHPRSSIGACSQSSGNVPLCAVEADMAITYQPRAQGEVTSLDTKNRPTQQMPEPHVGLSISSAIPTLPPSFTPTPAQSTYVATNRVSSSVGAEEEHPPQSIVQATATHSRRFEDAGGRGTPLPCITAGMERRPFRMGEVDVKTSGGPSKPTHTDGAVERSDIPKNVFAGGQVFSESCFAPRGLKRDYDKTTDVVPKGELKRRSISAFGSGGTMSNVHLGRHVDNVKSACSTYGQSNNTVRGAEQGSPLGDGMHRKLPASRGLSGDTAISEARAGRAATTVKKELGVDSETLALQGSLEIAKDRQQEAHCGGHVDRRATPMPARCSLEKSHPPGYTRTAFYYMLVKALTGKGRQSVETTKENCTQ